MRNASTGINISVKVRFCIEMTNQIIPSTFQVSTDFFFTFFQVVGIII